MATQAIGPITSSDTALYRQGFSADLLYEGIIENPVVKVLQENGCINIETDLSKNQGGTATLYNQPRLVGKGIRGDADFYSNATLTEVGNRTLSIAKVSRSITYPLKGTQTQQFAAFKIDQNNTELLKDWTKGIVGHSIINHLGGNNASSLTLANPEDTFSGDDLLQVTGNNAVSAPSYWYSAGNQTAITTDGSITTTHLLSLKDFQNAAAVITSQTAGRPTWSLMSDKDYYGVAFVSMTGLNHLLNEAVTLGQGMQLQQIIQYQSAGGSKLEVLRPFTIPGIPFKFYACPDSWLPRGVTTSGTTTKANSRRCVIVGKKAIDMAMGAGFSDGGGDPVAGVNVEIDTEYKRMNKFGYAMVSLLWGCKKTQITGPNAASTAYDVGSYVITHYSAT